MQLTTATVSKALGDQDQAQGVDVTTLLVDPATFGERAHALKRRLPGLRRTPNAIRGEVPFMRSLPKDRARTSDRAWDGAASQPLPSRGHRQLKLGLT